MIIPNVKENLEKNINVEIQLLDTTISNYEVKSKILSTRINSRNNNSNLSHLHNLDEYSTKLNSYISSLNNLKNLLYEILSICKVNINDEQIDEKIRNYNEQYKKLDADYLTFLPKLDTYIYSSIKTYRSDLSISNYKIVKKNANQTQDNKQEIVEEKNNQEQNTFEIPSDENISENLETEKEEPPLEIKDENKTEDKPEIKEVAATPINEITDNNTLVISEIQSKVFLPYTVNDLQKILDENKNYSNMQEIIEDVYTLPISKYKFANKSRFKETYDLMRKKEKASIFESLNIAFEQTFNTSLNPAIITACKNLDELDIYLDCLDTNETSKFPCFEIKFESLPTQK